MEKVSIVNAKGGVAKTTSCVNFASILAERGKRVLLVDMDPQSNSTLIYTEDDQEITHHVGDLLLKNANIDVRDVILPTRYPGVDLLPAHMDLRKAERFMMIETITSNQQRLLQKTLQQVEDDYDYCLIDCPPQMNLMVVNALVASDRVLVPIKVDKYALEGLEALIDEIDEVRQNFNENLVFSGCFFTMDTNTVVNREVKEAMRESLGDLMYKTVIRQNVKVVESTFERLPVNMYKRYCNASVDYRKLANEIFV